MNPIYDYSQSPNKTGQFNSRNKGDTLLSNNLDSEGKVRELNTQSLNQEELQIVGNEYLSQIQKASYGWK